MVNRVRIAGERDIEAIVFDMDGLLFDSEKIVQRSWTRVSNEMGLPDVGSHIYNTLGFNAKRRQEYFYNTFGADFPYDDFAQRTRAGFQNIARREGIPLKTGVRELLEFAKGQKLKLAVATSTRQAEATAMLDNEGISCYFDGMVFGDVVKNAKPDPEIFLTACEIIEAAPEDSIALEDSPAGIQSAHAAGMLPIMIPDLVQPKEEIRSLCFRQFKTLKDVQILLQS